MLLSASRKDLSKGLRILRLLFRFNARNALKRTAVRQKLLSRAS